MCQASAFNVVAGLLLLNRISLGYVFLRAVRLQNSATEFPSIYTTQNAARGSSVFLQARNHGATHITRQRALRTFTGLPGTGKISISEPQNTFPEDLARYSVKEIIVIL